MTSGRPLARRGRARPAGDKKEPPPSGGGAGGGGGAEAAADDGAGGSSTQHEVLQAVKLQARAVCKLQPVDDAPVAFQPYTALSCSVLAYLGEVAGVCEGVRVCLVCDRDFVDCGLWRFLS